MWERVMREYREDREDREDREKNPPPKPPARAMTREEREEISDRAMLEGLHEAIAERHFQHTAPAAWARVFEPGRFPASSSKRWRSSRCATFEEFQEVGTPTPKIRQPSVDPRPPATAPLVVTLARCREAADGLSGRLGRREAALARVIV